MKISINNHTLPVKTLDTARIRDIAELQRQTGWKLAQIRTEGDDNETIGAAVVLFLSMHNAGSGITWDEVLDQGMDSFNVIPEPGDIARAAGGDASEPTPPADSEEADAAPAEEQPAT